MKMQINYRHILAHPALWFALGVGAGVLIGEKVSRHRTEVEIQQVKDHYQSRMEKEPESEPRYSEAETEALVSAGLAEALGYVVVEDDTYEIESVIEPPDISLESYDEAEDDEAEDDEIELDGAYPAELDDPDFEGEPFLIKKSQYDRNDKGYRQLELIYYDLDDILADSTHQPFPEVGIAGDCLWQLDNHSPIHIRNPMLKLDLEVTLCERPYAEVLAGIRDQKPRRVPKVKDEE